MNCSKKFNYPWGVYTCYACSVSAGVNSLLTLPFLSVFAWKPLTQDHCLGCVRQAVCKTVSLEVEPNVVLAHEKGKHSSCLIKIEDFGRILLLIWEHYCHVMRFRTDASAVKSFYLR